MNNLVNIVKSIVDKVNLELPFTKFGINNFVQKVVFYGGTFEAQQCLVSLLKPLMIDKFYMCNTLFLTKGKQVKDVDGNLFVVDTFEVNKWVILKPVNHTNEFVGLIMYLNPITYLHGDPKSTNNEYGQLSKHTANKTPFIWLVESYSFDDLPVDSSIEEAFNVRLFFMDWAFTKKWINDEHNENVIKPMQNLYREFKKIIEEDYNFKRLDTCSVTVRNRFGNSAENPNNLIIDEDLSGVEMNFKLEVYNGNDCC